MSEPSRDAAAALPRVARRTGCVAFVAWLAIALPQADDYGPTLDASFLEYGLGERTLAYLKGDFPTFAAAAESPASRPATPGRPAFPRPKLVHTTWPLAPTLSAASAEVFHERLGLLRPFPATHLPALLAAALAAALVAAWTARRLGVAAGFAASAFLLTSPRFFADAFNNLKDVPEAAFYAAALLAASRTFDVGGVRLSAATGVLAGLALAQKANALFLGPTLIVLAVARAVLARKGGPAWSPPRLLDVFIALATTAATYYALSPQHWDDPASSLRAHFGHVFATGNAAAASLSTEALRGARVETDGVLHFLWTTPPATLVLAFLGFANRRLDAGARALLALGVLVPPTRTLLPGMTNYDGVRHFWEFAPFLAVAAAAGADVVAAAVLRATKAATTRVAAATRGVVLALAVLPSAVATAAAAPDGTTYYNAFVGGLGGARAREVRDAGDYWANSYWRAVRAVRARFEAGAGVVTPIAPETLELCVRAHDGPEVRVGAEDPPESAAPLYVVYVLRRGWIPPLLAAVDAARPPWFELRSDGASILRIQRFAAGEEARRARDARGSEARASACRERLIAWIGGDAARFAAVAAVVARPDSVEDRAAALRALLPAALHEGLADFAFSYGAR